MRLTRLSMVRLDFDCAGGAVQTSVNNIMDEHLGQCALFEESQVGDERYNVFTGCPRYAAPASPKKAPWMPCHSG